MDPVSSRPLGLLLVIAGIVLALVGLLVWSGALGFLGRLPGDLRYEGEHTRFYFPLASCLLVSVGLSALAALVRFFLSR